MNSLSKRSNACGMRAGFIAGDENIIQNYNNSLNGAIGNKIIENTPYEIFNQNIENILM